MIFSRSNKRRIIELEGKVREIEQEKKQTVCLHNLEDRIFIFDESHIFVEKCWACGKIIQSFDNEIDWNKGRIGYMKARIEELEKTIAKTQEEKI